MNHPKASANSERHTVHTEQSAGRAAGYCWAEHPTEPLRCTEPPGHKDRPALAHVHEDKLVVTAQPLSHAAQAFGAACELEPATAG